MNDERPMVFEDGRQIRDFVHVSDIVQANLLALETDKADYKTVNIGTGRPISVSEISQMLAKGLGKNIEPEFVGKYREGDIRHCVADIAKARDLLNYSPKVKLEDGLTELLGWVKNQKPADRVATATAELAARRLVR